MPYEARLQETRLAVAEASRTTITGSSKLAQAIVACGGGNNCSGGGSVNSAPPASSLALADAALQKSQELLAELAHLDLTESSSDKDAAEGDDMLSPQSARGVLTGCGPVGSGDIENVLGTLGKQRNTNGGTVKTIEVPAEILHMITEMWSRMRELQANNLQTRHQRQDRDDAVEGDSFDPHASLKSTTSVASTGLPSSPTERLGSSTEVSPGSYGIAEELHSATAVAAARSSSQGFETLDGVSTSCSTAAPGGVHFPEGVSTDGSSVRTPRIAVDSRVLGNVRQAFSPHDSLRSAPGTVNFAEHQQAVLPPQQQNGFRSHARTTSWGPSTAVSVQPSFPTVVVPSQRIASVQPWALPLGGASTPSTVHAGNLQLRHRRSVTVCQSLVVTETVTRSTSVTSLYHVLPALC